jgi:uncharacterized membrane protein (UPF0127 family)
VTRFGDILRATKAAALIGAAAWAFAFGAPAQAGPCRADVIDIRGPGGVVRFAIEIADTVDERARGLMYRTHLDEGAGMLFIFAPPREVAFWMRNTPLPLDLVFIDASGAVKRVSADAVPFSDAAIPSYAEVTAVLEINAGLAARFGIVEGAAARHPAFAATNPVWPCDG